MPRRSPELEAHFAALGLRLHVPARRARSAAHTADSRWSAPPVREIAPSTLRVSASDGAGAVGPDDRPDRRDALEHRAAPAGRGVDPGGSGRRRARRAHPLASRHVPGSPAGPSARGLRRRGRLADARGAARVPRAPLLVGGAPHGARAERPGGAPRAAGPGSLPPRHADRARRALGVDDPRAPRVRGGGRGTGPAGRGGRRGARAGRRRRGRADGSMPTTAGRAGRPRRSRRSASRRPTSSWTTTASRARRRCCSRPFAGSPGPGSCWSRATPRASPPCPSRAASPSDAHALGGLALFVHAPAPAPGAPLPAAALAVTASRHAQRAGLAVDGDPATRWATAAPRAAGDWFRVDLRAAARDPRRAARRGEPRRPAAGAGRGGLTRRRGLAAAPGDAPAGAPLPLGRLRASQRRRRHRGAARLPAGRP